MRLHAEEGEFTAAQFRDRLANGRKVAIQILEFFDRHGVTLNRDDLRRVNRHRLDLFGPSCFRPMASGGESSLVGRSDFKSEWGSETVSGGFDSHSLPPNPSGRVSMALACQPISMIGLSIHGTPERSDNPHGWLSVRDGANDRGARIACGFDIARIDSARSAAQATSRPPEVCGSVSRVRCHAGSSGGSTT